MAARPFDMTPVSFLQSFTTRALHLAQRLTPSHAAPACIESLGLAASSELEENYRRESGVDGPFDADRYADCIVGIKNAIGGDFTRVPAEPGTVRVVARQCPFGDAVKQALPHNTEKIAGLSRPISKRQLKAGDFVFFNTLNRPYSHMGIYIGNGNFINAPSSGGRVRIDSLSNPYFAKRFESARTVFGG